MDLKSLIREVPDFPKPGISFKDITTLLKDGAALRYVVDQFDGHFRAARPDVIVGAESRGFILGAPLAYQLGVGFVLVRKPGKLPAAKERITYDLEYGQDALEIHVDAIQPGQKVVIVDDLLATGGTISATAELVKRLGGVIVGFAFIIELDALKGRDRLAGYDVLSLVHYDDEE
ncbi:adenine phosphoribosyltransferase [Hydrogenispora ethanolica]|jgi:adenine phosphoribosyltransferase|uniref:Adenine phosphoribosyltransferase n=1 Tax=Hydrogenispora ethanolica TaxID=1082276 RepID=A0A4R1R8M7_HYDET|nr:adenine phosphoribosyltransferase [Hydrogenispora ethanolica]TCL62006.1 adenine phosphoribosyltransferase [Hydrogenispora ethanolica]